MSGPAGAQAASPDCIHNSFSQYFAAAVQMVTLILDPGVHNLGLLWSERKGVIGHLTGQRQPHAVRTILPLIVLIPWVHAQSPTLQWSRATPSGTIPSPRVDAPVAYDAVGRQRFMFGGLDSSGDRNDLWAFSVDNQRWTQINPSGQAPNPRHGHTVTLDPLRRRVIVIAGQGAGFFGDAVSYDIHALTSSQLRCISCAP